jgi:type IV secretory pathway VirB10-like protein
LCLLAFRVHNTRVMHPPTSPSPTPHRPPSLPPSPPPHRQTNQPTNHTTPQQMAKRVEKVEGRLASMDEATEEERAEERRLKQQSEDARGEEARLKGACVRAFFGFVVLFALVCDVGLGVGGGWVGGGVDGCVRLIAHPALETTTAWKGWPCRLTLTLPQSNATEAVADVGKAQERLLNKRAMALQKRDASLKKIQVRVCPAPAGLVA